MGRGRVRRVGGSKGGDEAVDQQAAEERAVSVIANLMMVADSLCSPLLLRQRGVVSTALSVTHLRPQHAQWEACRPLVRPPSILSLMIAPKWQLHLSQQSFSAL